MSQSALLSIDTVVARRIPEIETDPTEAQIAGFRRAGVGVVRSLLRPEEAVRIRDAFMASVANGPLEGISEVRPSGEVGAGDPLARYPRMLHPHRHTNHEIGRIALQYMLDPRIWGVIRAVTREEAIAAQSMFYFKPPGARGQGLHQDNNPLAVSPGTCIAAWIALDECDAHTGALCVVPGSGPLDLLCDAEMEDRSDVFFNAGSLRLPDTVKPITAEMGPGDVLFFNGQVIHGSFPNTTANRWRRALIFHYAPASCREIAAFYHPLLAFDGKEVTRAVSAAGGICGESLRKAGASMA
jgi:ectoine hydroxylase-related dioxygenase (phytanoyl-CoA dioxygenase family)